MIDAREAVRRRPDYGAFRPLIQAADDAADELEEAVFLLGMLAAAKPEGPVLGPLRTLAGLLDEAAQEWVKALVHAAHVKEPGGADDTDDFLVAIDRIAALEHAADDAERALTAAAVRHAADFRQLHLYAAIGSKLEAAADALKHASLMLRDHLLAELTVADAPRCLFILPGETLPAGGAEAVGGKAWNLMRMAQAGLPVPPGFVLTTDWCRRAARRGRG